MPHHKRFQLYQIPYELPYQLPTAKFSQVQLSQEFKLIIFQELKRLISQTLTVVYN